MTHPRATLSALVALAAALPAVALVRAQTAPDPFPHERHAGLFPVCTGCHAGIARGAPDEAFPSTALCVRCHDGDSLAVVVWEGYRPRADNLAFDHARHTRALARAGDANPGCEGCHGAAPEERMRVAARPDPTARCLTCHAHAAPEHLGDATCSTCHVPLAESGFSRPRIAALPEPPDHDSARFVAQVHGRAAVAASERCATCHVRERCTACHVDASAPAIRAIPPAPAGMELPAFDTASYPLPATHTAPEWVLAHGARASLAACGTCHTREDCTLCHQRSAPMAVAALIERARASAPGAGTRVRAPASHLPRFFATDHGGDAAAQGSACATCHTPGFCASCHTQAVPAPTGAMAAAVPAARLAISGAVPPRLIALMRALPPVRVAPLVATAPARSAAAQTPSSSPRPGPGRGGFHPADFALRHAPTAYGQTMECATCHSVEAFCRTCHQEVGLTPATRPGPGFHDAQPLWLLGHGQAARQGLESCASCHRQADCVQCHSTLGSFRVNPHGASFDAARGWARAPETCLVCHLGKPL